MYINIEFYTVKAHIRIRGYLCIQNYLRNTLYFFLLRMLIKSSYILHTRALHRLRVIDETNEYN